MSTVREHYTIKLTNLQVSVFCLYLINFFTLIIAVILIVTLLKNYCNFVVLSPLGLQRAGYLSPMTKVEDS